VYWTATGLLAVLSSAMDASAQRDSSLATTLETLRPLLEKRDFEGV
jgi:hypothetical protein